MNAIIENNKEQLINYCKKHQVIRMFAFGSVTGNKFKSDSDIDLLISFSDKLPLLDYADNFFDLYYNLEALFNRKIDLVSEKSLTNPYLIESINNNKELIYESRTEKISARYFGMY